jgi:hypothetical protein
MTLESENKHCELTSRRREQIIRVLPSFALATTLASCSDDVDRVTRASMATKGTTKVQLIQALGPPSSERSISRENGNIDVCASEAQSDRAIEYHVKTWTSIFGGQSISSAAVVCLDKSDRVISAHLEQY